jgi:hypothetical protein
MRYVLLVALWSCLAFQIFQFFRKPAHFFTFPFLLTGTMGIFILPTLTYNATNLNVLPDFEFNLMCGNILACILAGYFGYEIARPKETQSRHTLHLDKLFQVNLVFIFIGIMSSIYLLQLRVEGAWSGLPVYLLFFARFLRPALVIQLAITVLKPNRLNVLLSVTCFSFLFYAVLLGRRSEVAILFLFVGTILHLLRGWNIPRFALPIGFVFGITVLTVVPEIRGDFQRFDYSGFTRVNYGKVLKEHFGAENRNEVIESAITLAAFERSAQAGWGAGIVNSFVQQYIPRGILGAQFKDALRLPQPDVEEIRREFSDHPQVYGYLSPIGYTSAFMEFRHFAFIFFFLLGYAAKYAYVFATQSRNLFWPIFYTVFTVTFCMSNVLYIGELFTLNFTYGLLLATCGLIALIPRKLNQAFLLIPKDKLPEFVRQWQENRVQS